MQQLDSKFSSPELKESIRNQISQQKDQLVASIRTKYATLYENIRLA